jgi:hypothetical protein
MMGTAEGRKTISRMRSFVFYVFVGLVAGHASMAHTLLRTNIHDGSKTIDNKVILKSRGQTVLKPGGVRVALEPATGENRKVSLPARIGKLRNNRRLYLVFKDLHANNPPDVIYQVYLNLPKDKGDANHESHAVGTLNFYASQYGASRPDFFFSYDVTDTLKNLLARKQLSEPLIVTILPADQPAGGSVPTIGQIQLIEQ